MLRTMARLFDQVSTWVSIHKRASDECDNENVQSATEEAKDTAENGDGTDGQVDNATRE